MSLLKKLDEDLKTALKNSDKLKLAVLRLVKAAIKNQQIDKGRELQDEEILAIFSTLAKQRRESIEQFSRGGRNDLVQQETRELEILQTYMPRQLSAEEIDAMILQAIQESSAKSDGDIGKVMKLLAPRVKGVADGKWVNSRVRELLHG
ncbi:MAG: GatB/YqeY domain-containing protein [Nitrospirota bacterium]|nr:GatB/YqeY domain-containing protein [Nitrospirota bacterium]